MEMCWRFLCVPVLEGRNIFKCKGCHSESSGQWFRGSKIFTDGLVWEEEVQKFLLVCVRHWLQRREDLEGVWLSEGDDERGVQEVQARGQYHRLLGACSGSLQRWHLLGLACSTNSQENPTLRGISWQVWRLSLPLPHLRTRWSPRILQQTLRNPRRHLHAQHQSRWDPVSQWKSQWYQEWWGNRQGTTDYLWPKLCNGIEESWVDWQSH